MDTTESERPECQSADPPECYPAKRRARRRVSALIWVGPPLAIWLILTLVFGVRLPPVSYPIMILIPGLIATRLIFLWRSGGGAGGKIGRTALWLPVIFLVVFAAMFFPYRVHREYRSDAPARFTAALPRQFRYWYADTWDEVTSLDLGTPETSVFHVCRYSLGIWESKSFALLCRYSPEDYAAEKAALDSRYVFRTEALISGKEDENGDPLLLEPYARIGDDEFRFLRPRDGGEDDFINVFYKRCFLVVTNDVTREIGYLAYEDADLDEAGDLTRFLTEYCCWDMIR